MADAKKKELTKEQKAEKLENLLAEYKALNKKMDKGFSSADVSKRKYFKAEILKLDPKAFDKKVDKGKK